MYSKALADHTSFTRPRNNAFQVRSVMVKVKYLRVFTLLHIENFVQLSRGENSFYFLLVALLISKQDYINALIP